MRMEPSGMGLITLIRETPTELPGPSHHVRTPWEAYNLEEKPHDHAASLISEFQPPGPRETSFHC